MQTVKGTTTTDRWPSSRGWWLFGETFQPGGRASPTYGSQSGATPRNLSPPDPAPAMRWLCPGRTMKITNSQSKLTEDIDCENDKNRG